MKTAKDHYDHQLASVYTWMSGNTEAAIQRNSELLQQLGVSSEAQGLAIDLGAGSGFQSIPLAEFGFSVMAIDFCSTLLSEWRDRAEKLSIRTVHDDILNFSNYIEEQAELVVCMGDTLTHLESLNAVELILTESERVLAEHGKLILTFRDYISVELQGTQRFIPVQSDESTILTCFLEYHQNIVEVHDLLYQKEGNQWVLKASSYPKLRLDPNWVCQHLQAIGMSVIQHQMINGMICIVAQKIR